MNLYEISYRAVLIYSIPETLDRTVRPMLIIALKKKRIKHLSGLVQDVILPSVKAKNKGVKENSKRIHHSGGKNIFKRTKKPHQKKII